MSSERRKPYPFDQIEPKWQAIWDERQIFHTPNPDEKHFDAAKPKFYVLDKARRAGIEKVGYQIRAAQGGPAAAPGTPGAPPPPPPH